MGTTYFTFLLAILFLFINEIKGLIFYIKIQNGNRLIKIKRTRKKLYFFYKF